MGRRVHLRRYCNRAARCGAGGVVEIDEVGMIAVAFFSVVILGGTLGCLADVMGLKSPGAFYIWGFFVGSLSVFLGMKL